MVGVVLALILSSGTAAGTTADRPLGIPAMQKFAPASGTWIPRARPRIVIGPRDRTRLRGEAKLLARDLEAVLGRHVRVTARPAARARPGDVVLRRSARPRRRRAEGYRLRIGKRFTILARARTGAFYGGRVTERTRKTLSERLRPARGTFGAWTLAELEGAADDIARWRAGLTDTARYRLTMALRQCLGAAVRWRYTTRNPAIEAGRNPEPRSEELLPFAPAEIDALAVELGPAFGPLVTFAAETGLRTNEWTALERRDIDRSGPAVLIQRRYADGVLTPYPKTVGSRRRVPLSARALDALDRLPPRLDTPVVFPAARGGYIGLDGWRTRHWYPALEGAGLRQRGPYQLRHTFATEALAAGISIFELARVMGPA